MSTVAQSTRGRCLRTIGVAFPSGSTLKALRCGSVGRAGVRTKTAVGRSVAWIFRRWGRFHLKWRFPLFLHQSPLYPSEWVTHDNRNIHAARARLLPPCCLYAADGAVQTWLSAVDLLLSDELRDLSAAARTAGAHRLHLNQTGSGACLSFGNRPRSVTEPFNKHLKFISRRVTFFFGV